MTWFWVTLAAYALLGLVSVVDRYLLSGPLPNPRAYTFYVGLLGMFVFLLTPFFGLEILSPNLLGIALLSGFLFAAGLLFLYSGLNKFEASRVVPATGGLVPVFTLIFSLLILKGSGVDRWDWLAFFLLVLGSVIITAEEGKKVTPPSLKFAAGAAVFFALSFVLAKYVYLASSFWSPFIWMKVGGFVFAAGIFAFSASLRRSVLKRETDSSPRRKKTAALFLANQALGAGGNVLQSLAIFLAPALYVAFVNALEGLIYVFVLIYTALAAVFASSLLQESFTKRAAVRKVAATVVIAAGILTLSL